MKWIARGGKEREVQNKSKTQSLHKPSQAKWGFQMSFVKDSPEGRTSNKEREVTKRKKLKESSEDQKPQTNRRIEEQTQIK